MFIVASAMGFLLSVAGAQEVENLSSAPQEMTSAGNTVFFTAEDGLHGRELWRTDGTSSGTELVRDLFPGPNSSNPYSLVTFRGHLFFIATTAAGGSPRLWRSDGTLDGTVRVEIPKDIDWSCPMVFEPSASFLYFVVEDNTFDTVWTYDGNRYSELKIGQGDVVRFSAEHEGYPRSIFHGEGCSWFVVGGDTPLLIPQQEGQNRSMKPHTGIYPLGTVRDSLMVSMPFADLHGRELATYSSQGTEGVLIKDIWPGAESGITDRNAVSHNDDLYFRANDGVHGEELWISDGTSEGTRRLSDSNPGLANGAPYQLTAAGENVFFLAVSQQHGEEVWVTRGTPETTRLVFDVNPGPSSSRPYKLYAFGQRLYFSANHVNYGEELWVTDGTENGTRLVKDIMPGAAGSEPYNRIRLGELLLFVANDGLHGRELWRTDGTEDGTWMLKDIYPVLGINPSSNPSLLTAAGPYLYFVVNTAAEGTELWRSDGTEAGTVIVADLAPGRMGSNPQNLTPNGDWLYFRADTPANGIELWRTRGNARLTQMVHDIADGDASSGPDQITVVDMNTIFLTANDGIYGTELWRSDGSSQGTSIVADICPGECDSHPKDLVVRDSILYFTADDGESGRELWRSDGTADGTRIVRDILPKVPGEVDKSSALAPAELHATPDALYFRAFHPLIGNELWRSQGTPSTTNLVRDIAQPIPAP